MTQYVYLNGEFVPEAEALVSVYDGGWLHGAGLFETMRAEHGRVFRAEAHLQRLRSSATTILRPIERAALPSRVDFMELLDRNGLQTARVRLTVSTGSMMAIEDGDAPRLTVCVTAVPLVPLPAEVQERGGQVVICSVRQSPSDPIARHKTTAHLPRLLGLREAQRARGLEALWFTTQNLLAEGSISNIFLVSAGVLKTPPRDTPVLPGTTRAAVLELAGRAGIEVKEGPLTINDLLDADEVFLTNAIMRIVPVVRVEKKDIGAAKVGPVTTQLREAYLELVGKECGG